MVLRNIVLLFSLHWRYKVTCYWNSTVSRHLFLNLVNESNIRKKMFCLEKCLILRLRCVFSAASFFDNAVLEIGMCALSRDMYPCQPLFLSFFSLRCAMLGYQNENCKELSIICQTPCVFQVFKNKTFPIFMTHHCQHLLIIFWGIFLQMKNTKNSWILWINFWFAPFLKCNTWKRKIMFVLKNSALSFWKKASTFLLLILF